MVYLGASGTLSGAFSSRVCRFLGDISYPIYITHFPLVYVYTAWVSKNKPTVPEAIPVGLLVLFSAIAIAYACLKWYDVPVRNWLKRRFMA